MAVLARPRADLALSVLGNGALMALGVLTSILSARLFPPDERGVIAGAMAWLLVVNAVADLGLSNAAPFYAAREGREKTLLATTIAQSLLQAAIFALPCLLVMLSAGLRGISLAFVLASLPVSLASTFVPAVFQGHGRHGEFNVLRLLGNAPYALMLIVAAFAPVRSVSGVLWGTAIFSLLLFLFALAIAWRWLPQGEPFRVDRELARTLWRYGLRSYVGNLAWVGNSRLVQLLLLAMAGRTALGYFAVAASYAQVPFAIASAFALLAPNRVGRLTGADAKGAADRLITRGGFATVGLSIAFVGLAPALVPAIFGELYRPSVAIAQYLCAVAGVLGLNFLYSAALRGLDRPFEPTRAEVGGVLVCVGASFALIPSGGPAGAAMSALLSAGAVLLILVTSYSRVQMEQA